jgi:hypothetical protein
VPLTLTCAWRAPPTVLRAMQPSRDATTVEKIDDITYVALRNSHELLAVYKVLASGRLGSLEDWPEQLGERA